MLTASFLLLLLAAGVESLVCPNGQQPCGSIGCYDPSTQGCTSGSTYSIQCINSCNGTCYSSAQYCYNSTKVCNNGELVCDVQNYNFLSWFQYGLTCYNSSQMKCSNKTLCANQYLCGSQCYSDYYSVCVNNETICPGSQFYAWWSNSNAQVCGPQKKCYDNSTSVCLNRNTVCAGLDAQLCGSQCYNTSSAVCTNGNVRCINSCNGTCYSNAQYCYNNTMICNNGELVCDVQRYNSIQWFPYGLSCYNSSQMKCSNKTLCINQYSCGSQCYSNYNSACVSNETICQGPRYFVWATNPNAQVCGSQKKCYDNSRSVCLNGSTVCAGLDAQLCGSQCYNTSSAVCTNGNVRCINSCNGTCYSNAQYCYNNTIICNNGELVCDVQDYSYYLERFPYGLTCYNSSRMICSNKTLCSNPYSCGSQCYSSYYSACVNNETICQGPQFYIWSSNPNAQLCGLQKKCYDNSTSVCMDSNGTLCSIGSQLCSGVCYNPRSQYCTGGNNTIYCLNNPSSSNCPPPVTVVPSLTPSTPITNVSGLCYRVQNCTTNSDCCQASVQECQCYRHNPSDVYGSCVNPSTTPVCGTGCPVQGKCRSDWDCCKYQCATVSFTDLDGQLISKKQCSPR